MSMSHLSKYMDRLNRTQVHILLLIDIVMFFSFGAMMYVYFGIENEVFDYSKVSRGLAPAMITEGRYLALVGVVNIGYHLFVSYVVNYQIRKSE